MKEISVCLWFDHQAEEAAQLYTSIFKNSKIGVTSYYDKASSTVSGQQQGSVLTVGLQIENLKILAMNGGPAFQLTPAMSFYVSLKNEADLREKWAQLVKDGEVRMELQKYPWAELYGWVSDRFGVDWQLTLAPSQATISPALLFTNRLLGKAQEAIEFYTSVFPNSKVETMAKDPQSGAVLYSAFTLNGQNLVCMEGPGTHEFGFTNANSLVVSCENQQEIDSLWEKLSKDGTIEECGWLKDKYGVSWQIVPTILDDLMKDPKKSGNVMKALLQMKKLEIAGLVAASNS